MKTRSYTGKNLRDIGSEGEEIVDRYLRNKDYDILYRNWYIQGGEIDFVAYDGSRVLFIEVKYRRSSISGMARESLSRTKKHRWYRSGLLWSHIHHLREGEYQYDFISLQKETTSWRLEHYRNIEMTR